MRLKVECKICKRKFNTITHTHLKKHRISIKEYKEKFPNDELFSDETKKKRSALMSGENHYLYGKHLSKETREKISIAKKGIKRSEDVRKKISEGHKRWHKDHPNALAGKNNPLYGKHHSQETRKKISEALLGKTFSEEHRRKISERMKGTKLFLGRHHSEETKRKISEERRQRQKKGWKHPLLGRGPFKGRFHSAETKLKLSTNRRKWIQEHGLTYLKSYYVKELGHSVRSKWEEEIGLLLKENNIPYGYEARTFKFNGTSYTPDFIVGDNVIEVKGPVYDWQMKKYGEFNELHPELNFILVGNGSDEICDIHIPWKEREKLVEILR